MTINAGKFKLQKKHLAFFTIVPLLAVTALINVPCPICHGEGQISSTGMEEVYVTKINASETASIFRDGCDSYRVHQYSVTLTLQNNADHDAGGYINLILVNYQTGKKLDTQFIIVEVPAHTSVEHASIVYFMTTSITDRPDVFDIQTEVLKSNVACKTCSSTGKVALNTLALSQNLKDNFAASQRVETPVLPPLWIDSEAQPGDF